MLTDDTLVRTTPTQQEDTGIARWGGLSGLAGSALMLGVLVFVIATTGLDDELTGAAAIAQFPQVRWTRTIENGGYLAALLLWAPLAVALAHRLRAARPANALFGAALNGIGLAVLAAGALPHLVSARLSELYHAVGATAAQQSSLAQLWVANQGLYDSLVVVGVATMSVGVLALGLAMRSHPAFGRPIGTVSVLLGVLGLGTATFTLVLPDSLAVGFGALALVAFHALAGWTTFRTATATAPR